MPYINIRVGTTLDSVQRDKLSQNTTFFMNTIMDKRREVTVVHIQEDDPHQWSTNAIAIKDKDPISAYVDIKVTEGTNNPEEKSKMIYETVKMLQEVVGTIQEACYVVVDDIPANSWGYNGKTQAARAAIKL